MKALLVRRVHHYGRGVFPEERCFPLELEIVDRTFNLAAGAFFAAAGLLLALNIRNCAGWLAERSRFSVFFRPSPAKRAPIIGGIGWVWLVGGSLVVVAALFR